MREHGSCMMQLTYCVTGFAKLNFNLVRNEYVLKVQPRQGKTAHAARRLEQSGPC